MTENKLTIDQIKEKINGYRWYHTIEIGNGLKTVSHVPHFDEMWEFNLQCLQKVDFTNKRVLDIGCRDGLFSLYAERNGAKEVIGIDNDLSLGAVEFLLPHLKSNVKMREMNLYDLDPEELGKFDVVIFFGVLYHLRYPIWGLRKISEMLADGGKLIIESGMLVSPELANQELMYCPVERSPYNEPSSCTFFNALGLEVTLRSLNVSTLEKFTFFPKGKYRETDKKNNSPVLKSMLRKARGMFGRQLLESAQPKIKVARQFFVCEKNDSLATTQSFKYGEQVFDKEWATSYWDKTHDEHSRKLSIRNNEES